MKKKTVIITDPKEITRICLNQPAVSGERMKQSIISQNKKNKMNTHT